MCAAEHVSCEPGEDNPKVAIDPGHGDQNDSNKQVDPGAVNKDGVKEKDLTLLIANAITAALKADGYQVAQTREGDVENAGKKLEWRIQKAGDAEIFVSIHINDDAGKGTTTATGLQVHYNTKGANLAKAISAANTVFANRNNIADSSLYLLNRFSGPAVLVEVGFINNPSDLAKIQKMAPQIGGEIAKGIETFTKESKKK